MGLCLKLMMEYGFLQYIQKNGNQAIKRKGEPYEEGTIMFWEKK